MPPARPNVFQHLMRQWEAIHPYNAAQAMRLTGPADIGRAADAWRAATLDLGLGTIVEANRRYRFDPTAGAGELHIVPPGEGVEGHLSAALNVPFGDEAPFRPFVIEGEQSHLLGIVYRHWVADSVSVRSVARAWLDRLRGRVPRAIRHAAGGYWRHFGPGAGGWRLGEAALDQLSSVSRLKRARRLPPMGGAVRSVGGFDVRFRHHVFPDGLIGAVHGRARGAGVRVGDVLLAAAAEAAASHVPLDDQPGRRDLAVGNIVDLRSLGRGEVGGAGRGAVGEEVFGLFLGYLTTIYRGRDLADFPKLLRSTAAQSRRDRRDHRAAASMVRLAAGRLAGRLVRRADWPEFYRKRVPLAAGLSNVNLAGTWVTAARGDGLTDYLRASPTGPAMPLVFAPTTLGEGLGVGVTYRPAVLSDAAADAAVAQFRARLEAFAGDP